MSELLALMPGARNCIRGYSAVQPGESVLLWTDASPEVDPAVVDALALAADEAGADVSRIVAPAPVFRLGQAPPRVVAQALRGADVLVHIFGHNNAASIDNVHMLRYLFEYPLRITAVIANNRTLMTSNWARYPMELYWLLFRKAAAQVRQGPFRLTDPNGTDLSGTFPDWPASDASSQPAGITRSGSWTFFPSGNIPLFPDSPLNGVLACATMEGHRGLLAEPFRLVVRDHWVTEVQGRGSAADWLRRAFERYPNANYVCELTWGIHPKAGRSAGLRAATPDTLLYRHPGVWHVGLGMWPGAGVACRFHWDVGGLDSTLVVAGETIIDGGRLAILDDPELRALADRCGDGRELLAVED